MAVQMSRVPLNIPSEGSRDERLRAWVQQRTHEAICCNGCAPAQILIPFAEHADRLDLERVVKEQPEADLGATFRELAGMAAGPVYLILSFAIEDGAGTRLAIVLEEQAASDGGGRQWWAATLRFDVDEATGVGRPEQAWQASNGTTRRPQDLPEVLRPFIGPPAGARPAQVMPPGVNSVDIRMTFGELPAPTEPPTDVVGLIHLTRALCERPLLDGELKGMIVVKLMGRAWEAYQLRGPMPGDPATMIRYLANAQEPVADGVAMLAIVVYPERGPDPGVQIVAQQGGQISETWMPLAFPNGRSGRPVPAGQMMLRAPRPVSPQDQWIGTVPDVEWTLPMLGVGEA